MKRVVYIVWFLLSVTGIAKADDRFLIAIKRNYSPRPEKETVTIILDYNEVAKRLPGIRTSGLTAVNQNFGTPVEVRMVQVDQDPLHAKVVFEFTFTSSEPVYTIAFRKGIKKLSTVTKDVRSDARLDIIYLTPYADFVRQGNSIGAWPDKIIGSTMKTYPDPSLLSINAPGAWNYEYGFFLNGTMERWEKTKRPEYLAYVKQWADRFIDDRGALDKNQYNVNEYRLDDILPGRLFLTLYQITGEEKYKNAAASFENHLLHQPKTSEGGYWHKQIYPYQMWLDGIYMGDVFATQYASVFNKPELFNESIHQIKLIAQHNTDSKTGLLFHGWDESKNKIWADQQTGTSHEFWGRGIGWYLMALIDCLDYIPKEHPERKDVETLYRNLAETIVKHQDKKTELWFQVIDKGGVAGNWIETSCSAMFAYALAKGHTKGLVDRSYYDQAKRAFDSLLTQHVYFDKEGVLYLDQTVKVATLNPKVSAGDYTYYVGLERRLNDYKGLAALLYASMTMDTDTLH